jgi:hypothetical protein
MDKINQGRIQANINDILIGPMAFVAIGVFHPLKKETFNG